MLPICQAIGIAIATVPTGTVPLLHSAIAIPPVPTSNRPFISASATAQSVVMRIWRR